MAANVRVIGANELGISLAQRRRLMADPELITWQLALNMSQVVHRVTGYLQSSIYHKGPVAGAKAPYAGIEEERGPDHDYATQAIENFSIEKYADKLVEPL